MMKYGQQQDNVFDIIEKGNFFTPTKGEEASSTDTEYSPRKAKALRTLKWIALGIFAIAMVSTFFAIFGSEFW